MDRLEELRRKIDELDAQIVELLNMRAGYVEMIGKIKQSRGMDVYCPEREAEVIRKVLELGKDPLEKEHLKRIFERIVDESRSIERRRVRMQRDEGTGNST